MPPVIGIDFGTTNSLCAWLDGERPTIIPNARGQRFTPSVVAITAKGETLVGESAKNQAYINPENTLEGVKRHIGSESPLSLGGKLWRAEEIAALILASMKRDAEQHLQCDISRAVITAPAHFSDRERRALTEAGSLAGLNVLRIVNEPTAAALARSWDVIRPDSGTRAGGKSLVLVYDYGGGTFDVTLLEREGGDCRVLSSRGDGRLGGSDLDRELRRMAADSFKASGLDLESDRFLAQELAVQAEKAKIELSERSQAAITLAFASSGGKIVHPVFELSRESFEELALPYVERSLQLVEKTLADAHVSPKDVSGLVLSGGSSRIPLVRRLLKDRFGLEPEGGINPEEIVALGAAVCANLASGSGPAAQKMHVSDVVSRSYGVEIDGGAFVPLVRKNSPVPAVYSRVFTTVSDNQDSVEIHVLQGESRLAAEDLSLGRFLLAGILPSKAGVPRVKVDFTIDESDMLHVSAVDLATGAQQAISIADLGRGASSISGEELSRKVSLLLARIAELRDGLALERGLAAELDEAAERARRLESKQASDKDGELRMLKVELEGLIGELLARKAEARSDAAKNGRNPEAASRSRGMDEVV